MRALDLYASTRLDFGDTLIIASMEQEGSHLLYSYDTDFDATRIFWLCLCFAMLVWVWYGHYRFFRHFGLQDPFTILLNSILLFVVLFYIYPLKFLFTLLANRLF